MNRRWIVLVLLFVGIVICYIDRSNLSIASPSIMQDFRIRSGTMGVVLSAFFWTYALFQIPAGALVDRFGIRTSYAAGFLVWSLASASIALSRGTGDIIGLRLVLGLAESTAPLASVAFIRNNFAGEDQGLPTSVYAAGQSVGPAFGALVGAILIDQFGWRMMFAITGLGALTWLPFWLIFAPSKAAQDVPQTGKTVEYFAAPAHWTKILTDRTFWAMSLAILFSSYYWYFVLTWMPSFLIFSRGFSTLAMGRVVSAGLFTMAVVNVIAGGAVDNLAARIGMFRARLLFGVIGYFGTGSILLLLVIPGRAWVLPVFTVSMCATGIGNTNYWTISQLVPPKHLVGRTIGFLNTISVMAGAVAPMITGWMLGSQKHFGRAVFVAGTCPVLAAICLIAVGTRRLERMKALLGGEVYTEA